jgi:hypothetical protein
MTSERKDPREEVLDGFLEEENERGADAVEGFQCDDGRPAHEILETLDAADPLRAILPEVVEALEGCEKNLRILHDASGEDLDWDPTVRTTFEVWNDARSALARLREIHPTTGGTDDGE